MCAVCGGEDGDVMVGLFGNGISAPKFKFRIGWFFGNLRVFVFGNGSLALEFKFSIKWLFGNLKGFALRVLWKCQK